MKSVTKLFARLTHLAVLVGAGKKVPDYWDASKKLLNDPSKFLDSLLTYDKDNIPDATIQKVEPYIAMEEFTPAAVSKVSKACTSICMWARAMYMYHNVALSVSWEGAGQGVEEGETEVYWMPGKLWCKQAAV